MYFQPIDEMSLRHLFSSGYGEDVLRMSYLGPVLDASGNPQTSPDGLVLDKREKRFRIKRCEFKYIPSGKKEFEHCGRFDLAVVWSIPPTTTKQELQKELLAQNGCHEVVVLSEFKAFADLPKYHEPEPQEFNRIDELQRIILKRDYPTVFAAFIAAKIYPEMFDMGMMVDTLSNIFPEVKRMQPRGRANVVSALIQTKPPLLKHMHGKFYRWNDDINPTSAVREIEKIIRTRFLEDIPSAEIIDRFKKGPLY